MPNKIRKASPMSLWNSALEVHTGRIFENVLGPFYILYVPLAGICILLVLISGVLLWWKAFRKIRWRDFQSRDFQQKLAVGNFRT